MKILSFLLLPLAACSASYDLSEKAGTYARDTGGDADSDSGEIEDTDTAAALVPAWYVVRAELTVADGLASAADAWISLDVIDADLERVDCVVDLVPDDITAGEVDAEGGFLWWDLPVRAETTPCAPLPEALSLGVGTLHPDARARLGAVGHDDIADSLYGAWLRADGAEASVYGYAGTADDLAGDDVATFPPPDGLYELAPLYVVALPAE